MAKLTKADAARQLGIARSTLYKLIAQGKVSCAPDGLIDQAELVRVAAYVDTFAGRSRTLTDMPAIPVPHQAETPHGRPRTDVHEQHWTDQYERPQASEDVLVDLLRDQLHLLRDELQAAREREAWLRHQLEQVLAQNQRLLEAPRPQPPARFVLKRMTDAGLLRRVAPGVYGVAE
jgi:hypothetical protein